MSEKNFLLGVGCQKGGTTWLHQYLDSHPQCNLGFQKEYHIFDANYLEACSGIYRNRLASLESLLEEQRSASESVSPRLLEKIERKKMLVSFHKDPHSYAQYFADLYDDDPNAKLVGDITPAYSALGSQHYSEIRSVLESKGFTVKVVFLMRDPIERIYSSIYMEIERKNRRQKENDQSPEALFLSKYSAAKTEMKTRYEKTVTALETAFAAENIYLGFYETLFDRAGVGKITDFLGIDFIEANTDKKVHAAKSKKSLSSESIRLVRDYYDDTYQFCYQHFGREFISGIWRNAERVSNDEGFFRKLRKLTGI